jgi:hypothetical protein
MKLPIILRFPIPLVGDGEEEMAVVSLSSVV